MNEFFKSHFYGRYPLESSFQHNLNHFISMSYEKVMPKTVDASLNFAL